MFAILWTQAFYSIQGDLAKAWTIFTAKSAKKTFKTSRSYPHPLVPIT
jgi:hypothetical protein